MSATLPYSVALPQPHAVPFGVYRIRMASNAKKTLIDNLVALLRRRTGEPLLERAQWETELRRCGMQTGNAQRLFDDQSDPRLSRLDEVSRKVGVPLHELLMPGSQSSGGTPAAPLTLEAALPLLFDAMASAEDRGRLAVAFDALLKDDQPEYRAAIARMLGVKHADRTPAPVREAPRAPSRKGGAVN